MSIKSSGSPGRSYHNKFSSSFTPTSPAPQPSAVSATGGTKFTDSGFTYHVFTGISSDFVVTQGGTVEILMVGGGGSGSSSGGGGGAGGVVHDSTLTITDTTYTVEVGEGGDWTGTPSCSGGSSGLPGYATTFKNSGPVNLIALGGGGGAYCTDTPSSPQTPTSPSPVPAGSGGSGAGGGRVNPGNGSGRQPLVNQVGGSTNLVNYGNNGGTGGAPGGGGGGASAAGDPTGPAGDGQPFTNFPAPVFSPVNFPASWTTAVGPTGLFGGGGGGGGYPSATAFGGGTGGGGDGAGYDGVSTGSPGEDHTGGGGGSGSYPGLGGGSGGTGVLIIRYSST